MILPITDQSSPAIVAASIDIRNNLEILFTQFKDNQQILAGINLCLEADQLASQNYPEAFVKYQSGIAMLLPSYCNVYCHIIAMPLPYYWPDSAML